MRSLSTWSLLLMLVACSKHESPSPAPTGSATPVAAKPEPAAEPPPATPPDASAPSEQDAAAEVAQLVVKSVGSKALGSQVIDASCVAVAIVPAGDWTVAAARLRDCGDKTARSIIWVYKRKGGAWNEDYGGQPPKCWKGVPADIGPAVAIATKIPTC
jgi:hypothetical protein